MHLSEVSPIFNLDPSDFQIGGTLKPCSEKGKGGRSKIRIISAGCSYHICSTGVEGGIERLTLHIFWAFVCEMGM